MFVGDAKYKRLDGAGFKHADLYQLLAYATAANLDHGLLVYAAGEADPAAHKVRFAGIELLVASLDLSGEPAQILDEVGRIADGVRSNALGSRPGCGGGRGLDLGTAVAPDGGREGRP